MVMAIVDSRHPATLVIRQVNPVFKSLMYFVKDYPGLTLVLTYSAAISPVFRGHARGLRDTVIYLLTLIFRAGHGRAKIYIDKMRSTMAAVFIRAAFIVGGAPTTALM